MKGLFKAILIVLSLFVADLSFAACTVTTTAMNFPSYNLFSLIPTDSTGTVTIECTENVQSDVSMGASSTSGGFSPRQMSHVSGVYQLNYNLYTDATYTSIWGDGAGGGIILETKVKKNKPPTTVTVYGRIPAGQTGIAGAYSDSVTILVEWWPL
ncbi:MAG: spore coat U domain-containing protein [Thermodesulfobacteriota bacterium]